MTRRIRWIKDNLYRFNPPVDDAANKATANFFFRRGLTAIVEDKLEEASQCYQKALIHDPFSKSSWLNLGFIYWKQRRPREAKQFFGHAIAIDPEYALAHYNLAYLLDEACCFHEAFEGYCKAVAINPEFADAHYNLALLHQYWSRQPRLALHHYRLCLLYEDHSDLNFTTRVSQEIERLERFAVVHRRPIVSDGHAMPSYPAVARQ